MTPATGRSTVGASRRRCGPYVFHSHSMPKSWKMSTSVWMPSSYTIYQVTMGQEGIVSFTAFYRDVFTTGAGWALIVVGVGVGFLFAVLVLTISVVSFPMLLDRDVGLFTAVATSVHAVVENPVPMAVWGLIVAGGLVLGSLPALLGLIIVMPVLGHATWHLYRKVVPR